MRKEQKRKEKPNTTSSPAWNSESMVGMNAATWSSDSE